jgi:hypothetical protein
LFNVGGVGILGRPTLLARQANYVTKDRGQTRTLGRVQHSPNISTL